MKVAVVGAGMCGLGLAEALSAAGHEVEIFDGGREVGGLVAPHDFGAFTWDRFYHCIMPQDAATLRFVRKIGLGEDLAWKNVRTGFFGRDALYSLSGGLDLLRFPLLSLRDKFRLVAFVRHVGRLVMTAGLRDLSAAAWLRDRCGDRVYDVFWRPLLKAKFGPYHDRVAAILLYHIVRRSFDARSGDAAPERLGYVRGGYARILARTAEVLASRGVRIHLEAVVTRVTQGRGDKNCSVDFVRGGQTSTRAFDQCFFSSALPADAESLFPDHPEILRDYRARYPNARRYLDIVCGVLELKRPLSPYYVINIGDDRIPLTGVVEMTNLVDAGANTAGRSLVYLPKYVEANAPESRMSSDDLYSAFVDNGVRRIFPDFARSDVLGWSVHVGRNVQPLAFSGESGTEDAGIPALVRPVQILNSAMTGLSNLHVNSVLRFAESFVSSNASLMSAV